MTITRANKLLGAGVVGVFLALLVGERARPLRLWRDPSPRRILTNLAVGAITAAVVAAMDRPITAPTAGLAERRRFGLVPRFHLPASLATAASLVLMDYTLYWWHVLLHRVPLLWRCHAAHHADRDLDTSTAARFHFAEFVLSVPWRVAQIVAIGVSRQALSLWSALTFAEVVFHHSNLRLPLALERVLSRFIVTPRMHGIHHSTISDQRNSNYSSGLTLWDFLHRTFRLDVPQRSITIGLPDLQRPDDVTLERTLALPFVDDQSVTGRFHGSRGPRCASRGGAARE